MNCLAARALREDLGIASAQLQAQAAPLGTFCDGGLGKTGRPGHPALAGIEDVTRRRSRVHPNRAVAVGEQRPDFIVAIGAGARRPVLSQQVDIEAHRLDPLRAGELRLPAEIHPPPAKRIDQRTEVRHVLAPSRLSAQADAVNVVRGIVQSGGEPADLLVAGLLRHFQARLAEEILPVIGERALRIERRRIHLALIGQSLANHVEDVVVVIVRAEIVNRQQPPPLRPKEASRMSRW